ncbi:hypothetical protein PAESOLCIP111_06730 [Paenibacillus solanacearum]|uniref:Uncharacterized protein n=1 Tax=Paenibacillus solanacearum TaxID=2048548 RepID=A0A916K8F6_9BACL|nr:hypothetical protein PAESOLCIP111_06730 [Paenibacillus solanacearum]
MRERLVYIYYRYGPIVDKMYEAVHGVIRLVLVRICRIHHDKCDSRLSVVFQLYFEGLTYVRRCCNWVCLCR